MDHAENKYLRQLLAAAVHEISGYRTLLGLEPVIIPDLLRRRHSSPTAAEEGISQLPSPPLSQSLLLPLSFRPILQSLPQEVIARIAHFAGPQCTLVLCKAMSAFRNVCYPGVAETVQTIAEAFKMPTRLIWPVFIFPRVSADGGEEDGNHDRDSGLPITITTQHRALIKGLSQCLNKYGGSAQVNLATCEWLDAHSELLPRRIHVQILNSSCDEFDIYESDPPMVLLQTMARHLGRSEIMSLSLCCYDGQFEDAIVQALRTLHIKEMILQGYVPADFADALKGIRGLQKICIKRAEHDALIEVDLRACPNVKVLEFREPQPSILALVEQLVLDLQRCCLERILFTGELNHVVRRGLEKWEGTLAVLKWTCTFSGRGPICWDRQEPLPQ